MAVVNNRTGGAIRQTLEPQNRGFRNLASPRPAPSTGRPTKGKGALVFDFNNVLEKFRGGRPTGVAYVNPQVEFSDANAYLRTVLVDNIVQVLEDRIGAGKRPQRGTEYLVRALRDPRITSFNSEGFTFDAELLDSTEAGPYYRNLEYGSNVFVGRVIEGFFFGADGKYQAPGESRTALQLIQRGKFINPTEGGRPSGSTQLSGRQLKGASSGTQSRVLGGPNAPGAGRFETPLPGQSASARIAGTFPTGSSIRGVDKPRGPTGRGRFASKGTSRRGSGDRIIIKNPIPEYAYIRNGTQRFLQSGIIKIEYRRAGQQFIGRGGLIIP